ncbi:ATP-dependent DNA helicase RecG [Actinobacillus equuli]|nr:ATP-dependent DNA helicase RecG [Actinobacillus equuli]
MAEIHHPEYQIIRNNQPLELAETLTPIYSTTEGLKQIRYANSRNKR